MRSGWTRFTGLGVGFSYPPEGAQCDEGPQRVHLASADRRELYFEVARFPGLTPQDEYARHRPYLEERFGAGSVTDLSEATLHETPAWSYSFGWEEDGRRMERTAILWSNGGDTWRIIRDPRSALNDEVLATLTLE